MDNTINLEEVNFSSMSLVDPVGVVFSWRGRLFRAISYEEVENIKAMFDCGMIDALVNKNLFPRTWITSYKLDGYGLIVEHEKIPAVNYPYEWSFLMLKAAAIAVLQVNLVANQYGYQTKDCHGYNIIFDGCYPKFVDLGSFVKLGEPGSNWIAYEEFIRFYYYVLSIWKDGSSYLARRALSSDYEMLNHDEFYIYRYTYLISKILKNTKKYISKIAKYLNIKSHILSDEFGLKNLNNISFVSKKIENMHFNDFGIYKKPIKKMHINFDTKLSQEISKIINIYDIEKITYFSAVYELSKLIIEKTNIKQMVCVNTDEHEIDKIYELSKTNSIDFQDKKILPVLLNFLLPVSNYSAYPNNLPYCKGRFLSDAIISLSGIDYAISLGFSIDYALKTIAQYTKRYALIGFSTCDSNENKQSGRTIPEWHIKDFCRDKFQQYFELLLEQKIDDKLILFGKKFVEKPNNKRQEDCDGSLTEPIPLKGG
ncbi:hypothetical protein SAMD00079811_55260 [Scytonema sp. HK-05]|uniref:hypothetical protein n=1 Tax=Scytonema sp. HK-05 TaxID=1137095 RepID=UPI0009359099|nr:hypothetical protein [Scytonema sp. HK-05]OKH59690.1 hypothetical protein NIES2130_07465 [Scytonema sp. HK-05]BAY47907.1 hypothetical protein SAMD00079811_55260 [Scytonema sp. HK-05]